MSKSKRLYANNAKSILASAVFPSDTTITVADGSLFPSPNLSNGEYFSVTIESGSNREEVWVQQRSGNVFSNCVRAREGSTALSFSAGAKVENRATKETFESFLPSDSRFEAISSIENLEDPTTVNPNSYISSSYDDGGNPILAVAKTNTWRLLTHSTVVATGTISSSSTTSLTSSSIGSTKIESSFSAGRYIVQFTSGTNVGKVRLLSSSGTNVINWTTSLTGLSNGTSFEVYKSDYSILQDLLSRADNGLVYAILFSE